MAHDLRSTFYILQQRDLSCGNSISAWFKVTVDLDLMQWLSGGFRRFSLKVELCRCVFIRCYGRKLFVGGLSYDTNETILCHAFKQYGDVVEVKVICDRMSGKSKGYGFVHFDTETAAEEALRGMDGQLLEGRNIRLEYARGRTHISDELEKDSNQDQPL